MDLVIAVDGPAASGKGTVAGQLAEVYGLPYLDTGLIYRAVAVIAQRDTARPLHQAAVRAASSLVLDTLADPALRSRGAGELASQVAAIPQVRAALLDFQRGFAAQSGGAVLDGRDIGTVIAPHARAKLYVTAAAEVRAHRRWTQLVNQGDDVTLDAIRADIALRDARDAARADAPLVQAADAILLDTTELSISESVDAARRVVEAARARQELSGPANPIAPLRSSPDPEP